MSLTMFFSLQKIEKGWFYKTRVAYSCNFFSKDGLFHKTLVLSLMGFCTGCCNLQLNGNFAKLSHFQPKNETDG